MKIRTLVALTSLAIAAILAVAWIVKPAPYTSPAAAVTTPTTTPNPTPSSDTAMTDAAFNIAWDGYSTTDRDDACEALNAFGPTTAAQYMAEGGQGADLDWDRMAVLLGDACDSR